MANVKIYINFLKISCIVYDPRLQSELKDAKRLTKLLIRFFFCLNAFIVGFFLIRQIRSRTGSVKFALSKSFKHVQNLSLERHASSCILFVTHVLDRSVIVDVR